MMDNALKTKEEKKAEAEKEQEEIKKVREKMHQGEEEVLDNGEFEELRATKVKLPPYFENVSRDIMLNKKLKILLQKSNLHLTQNTLELERRAVNLLMKSFLEVGTWNQSMLL